MAMGWHSSKVLQSAVPLEVGGEDSCGSKDTRVVDVLETVEASENGHVGIRDFPHKMWQESPLQMKTIYVNAHSMDSKQEDLEMLFSRETLM